MTFPTTDLPVVVELALNADLTADPGTWSWTDITDYVRDNGRTAAIRYTVGRRDEAFSVDAGSCTVKLDNRDGRFTPRNPMGAYYGQFGKNTPIRVRILWNAVYYTRFSGFVSSWPPRWDKSGNDSTVSIRAYGILGRLGQGRPPELSALRRTIGGSNPVAYWPVEDGVVAGQAGSAISAGSPLTITGTVEFKAVDDYTNIASGTTTRYGTSALANLASGGIMSGVLTSDATSATASAWTVLVTTKVDPATTSGDVVLMEWETPGGSFVRWQFVSLATLDMRVIAYNSAGASTVVLTRGSVRTSFDTFAVSASQSGGNINVAMYTSSPGEPSGSVAGTLSGISRISVNTTGATCASQDMPFGHLTVWDTSSPPLQLGAYFDSYGAVVWDPLRSHLNEAAHLRLSRLADEDGIELTVPSVSEEFVQRLGWQAKGRPLDLYRQTEVGDQGVLYENGFGLGYLPREHRYNPSVSLALDFDQGHIAEPPEPTDDDQRLVNRWTVSRTEGSSAVVEDADSISASGRYESSVEVNHADDTALLQHASWRLHLGTVEEMRWPSIRLNLRNSTDIIEDWLNCAIGSRITIANEPDQVIGDTIDLIIEGYTESLGTKEWFVDLNCSPAEPWDVAEVDSGTRIDSESSALTAPVTSSATSISVGSDALDQWTTSASDLPVNILVGGELMTVTAISSSSGGVTEDFEDTTFNVTISGTWARNNAQAHSGSWSFKSATIGDNGTSDANVTVPAGATSMTFSWFADTEDSSGDPPAFDELLVLFDGVEQSFEGGGHSTSWTQEEFDVSGVSTVTFRYKKDSSVSEGADAVWIDDLTFHGPQTLTVTRSVNGVVKAHSAGTEVHVANPAIIAL